LEGYFISAGMSATTNSQSSPNGADITSLSSESLMPELLSVGEEADVVELIGRLDSADGLAKGVENRLDDLLSGLDSLLATLEAKEENTNLHVPPRSDESGTMDGKEPVA
jgi:hypothetical protein